MNSQQRQREAKFKEAVLRRLYPPSPPASPPPPPSPPPLRPAASSSPVSASIQGLQSLDQEAYKEQEHEGDITDCSEKNSGEEEEKPSKTSLNRAQRKRLKTKRLKEAKAKISAPSGRLIGPLMPGRPLTNDNLSTSFTLATSLDSNHHKKRIERNIDVEAECEGSPPSNGCLLLSKSKRRKLAKRKSSHDDQSRKSFVSVFTADAREHGFTIKKGPLVR